MDAARVLEIILDEHGKMEHNTCSPEVRLSTFLYIGKEFLVYHSGNMLAHNYFSAANVGCIEELAKDEMKQLLPVKIIKMAFESNLVPHPETLIFALAACCKQGFSDNLRSAAYAVVGEICSSPEHFILFIKFASQLSKQKETTSFRNDKPPCNGWGHGLRKAVNNWYLSKEPLELAKCITRCKGRYGWKHKDIIKLSHPHPDTPEKEAILKYIMHGLGEMKKSFGDNSHIKDLIEYIEIVEDFKHCKDEVKAAGLLEKYEFTLDHVPGHMLKSTEIWNSLIPSMNLHMLLNNLQRIHNLGLLKSDDPAVEKIIDQITDKESLSRDHIHPVFIYIILKNYENSGKPLSYEKRKMKEQAKKPFPPPPKPNPKIINALYQALNLSATNLKPTGLRYMITINADKVMWETCTWHGGNVNGAEAGLLIAYALSSEKNVTVAAFDTTDLRIINAQKSLFINPLMTIHHPIRNNAGRLDSPISWAFKKRTRYDVFINITGQIVDDHEYEAEFALYRDEMNLPDAKLINCVVCSSKRHEGVSNRNILTIYGFDATVPTVIQAFSTSLF